MPDKEGRTIVFRLGEPMIADAVRRASGLMVFATPNNMTWAGYKDFQWLEPIQLPDAQALRDALEKIRADIKKYGLDEQFGLDENDYINKALKNIPVE